MLLSSFKAGVFVGIVVDVLERGYCTIQSLVCCCVVGDIYINFLDYASIACWFPK